MSDAPIGPGGNDYGYESDPFKALPICRGCFAQMSAKFQDQPLCAKCFFEAQRLAAARPRLVQPSYTSPLVALERARNGRTDG